MLLRSSPLRFIPQIIRRGTSTLRKNLWLVWLPLIPLAIPRLIFILRYNPKPMVDLSNSPSAVAVPLESNVLINEAMGFLWRFITHIVNNFTSYSKGGSHFGIAFIFILVCTVLAFMWISKEEEERKAYPDSIRFFAKITFPYLPACYLFVVLPMIGAIFGSFWEGGGSVFIDFLQYLSYYWYHAIIISIYSALPVMTFSNISILFPFLMADTSRWPSSMACTFLNLHCEISSTSNATAITVQ